VDLRAFGRRRAHQGRRALAAARHRGGVALLAHSDRAFQEETATGRWPRSPRTPSRSRRASVGDSRKCGTRVSR
jgi:hypothetical protein